MLAQGALPHPLMRRQDTCACRRSASLFQGGLFVKRETKPGCNRIAGTDFYSPLPAVRGEVERSEGEGALPRVLSPAERPPHPNLLPARGEKECAGGIAGTDFYSPLPAARGEVERSEGEGALPRVRARRRGPFIPAFSPRAGRRSAQGHRRAWPFEERRRSNSQKTGRIIARCDAAACSPLYSAKIPTSRASVWLRAQ